VRSSQPNVDLARAVRRQQQWERLNEFDHADFILAPISLLVAWNLVHTVDTFVVPDLGLVVATARGNQV
jgi:hypothetical protein